jgi:hypothetical protein
MSKPTFSTTLDPDTVRSIFLDPDGDAEFLPRGIRASIIVIRSIRAGRSHHETTQWLVNPLTSRRRFDTEMVSPICASTDCCRVTAFRLGCSISSTHRWRPRRFGPKKNPPPRVVVRPAPDDSGLTRPPSRRTLGYGLLVAAIPQVDTKP